MDATSDRLKALWTMTRNGEWALHHVGIAVAEIGPATEVYVRRFGYTVESPVIHNPAQTAYVQFLRLPREQARCGSK